MSTISKTEFARYTPEELSELFKKDPTHFDEIADEAIRQACIGRTPEQTIRRRQLQWTIDAQLRKGKTPLERMQLMENIFYSQVYGLNGELAQLIDGCTELVYALGGSGQVATGRPRLRLVKGRQ